MSNYFNHFRGFSSPNLCSINTVYYMAPFATMILAVPALLLEGAGVVEWFQTHDAIFSALIIIISSGVLAFCLNFSIFYVIHSTTAVTFNVAGNLKVRKIELIPLIIIISSGVGFKLSKRSGFLEASRIFYNTN